MDRTRRALSVLALVSLLAWPAAARAVVTVAAPGSWLGGFYATPVTVTPVGGPLVFVNGDTAAHDVVALGHYGKDSQPWCGAYPTGKCPLFWSAIAGTGEVEPVLGVDKLVAGRSYTFYCSLHPAMRGTLVAV